MRSWLRHALLAVGLPFWGFIYVHFGFATSYSVFLYNRPQFDRWYDNGIYRFRVLGTGLVRLVDDHLGATLNRHVPALPNLQDYLFPHFDRGLYLSYFLVNLICYLGFSVLLYRLLHAKWLPLYLVVQIIVLISAFVVTPYDFLSYFLLIAAIYCLRSSSTKAIAGAVLLTFLGGLTRESASIALAFAGVIALSTGGQEAKRRWLALGAVVVTYAGTYLGLRLVRGFSHGAVQSNSLLHQSRWSYFEAVLAVFIFFVVAAVSSQRSEDESQSTLGRLLPSVIFWCLTIPYVIAVLVGGNYLEFRLVVPLVIGMALVRTALPELQTEGALIGRAEHWGNQWLQARFPAGSPFASKALVPPVQEPQDVAQDVPVYVPQDLPQADKPVVALNGLTGLRGIWAFCVFITHASAARYHWTRGAFPGVSYFFVLSGAMLAYSGEPRDSNYFRRRLARIVPTYWLFILIWVIYVLVDMHHIGTSQWLPHLFLVQSWTGNPKIALSTNYPAWSVSCEIAFYLTLPLWVYLGRKVIRGGVPGVLGYWLVVLSAGLIVAKLYCHYEHAGLGYFIYLSPITRCAEFALGACVGLAMARGLPEWVGSRPVRIVSVVLTVGAVVLAGAIVPVDPLINKSMGFTSVLDAPIFALLVMAWAKAECPRFLVRFGNASYTFYLGQAIIIVLLAKVVHTSFLLGLPYALVWAFASVWVSDKFEMPLNRKLRGVPARG